MPQWEYCKMDLNSAPRKTDATDLLNDLGTEGWELVAILSNNIAILKRQIEVSTPARSPRRKTASAPTE
jgi:hypothetical protein